jgi:hypothetical protein
MKGATPGAMRLMYASEKETAADDWGLMDGLMLVFFSTITAGVLPIVYISLANSRRRRMKRFFTRGIPGVGEFLKMDIQKLPFDEKIARVTYQFEADGKLHRDSDQVLPGIADRWQPGDRIPILYLPDQGYDSVIVAVE